jgi:hypothetical protein
VSPGLGSAVAPEPLRPQRVDWRVERLSALMGDGWLEGEWDPARLLVLPRPGGRLTRVLRCVVADCPSDRHGTNPLCVRHQIQFATSATSDLDAWLAGEEPVVLERRRCSGQRCAVTGTGGQGCPRPAQGSWRLCPMHDKVWERQRARNVTFEDFLTQARAFPDLGPCVAACCYLGAAHRETALCDTHFQIWRHDGRPTGRRFVTWAECVRQPVNSRVLSLRGLPSPLWLELLYAIGARAAEQVSVVTGGMRPWVDQLRAARVSSVCEFDLARLDGVGDAHHVRFARFTIDRVQLAYANVDDERSRDVWDLRLFGRPGRRHLDFTAIRQGWLREATKVWASGSVGRISDGVLQHRISSVAVLSAVLAAGPGGGEDPAALGRTDIERFLARVRSPGFPPDGRPFGTRSRAAAIEESALMIREARDLGLLAALGPTFAFRRGDRGPRVTEEPPGRALPPLRRRPARHAPRPARRRPGRHGGGAHPHPRRPGRAGRAGRGACLPASQGHGPAGGRGRQPASELPRRRRARQGRPRLRQPQAWANGPAPAAGRLGTRPCRPSPAVGGIDR